MALADEASYSRNGQLLQVWLDAIGGVPVARSFVRKRMVELEALKAVTLVKAGDLLIAKITEAGLEHVYAR